MSQKACAVNKIKVCTLSVLLIGAMAWSNPGHAQSSRDINNRLNRMENELETMGRAVYRGETTSSGEYMGTGGSPSDAGAASSTAAADMEVRLQDLETQIRKLNGTIEEQSYAIQQTKEQLERFSADVDMRLQALEGHAIAAPTTSPTPTTDYPNASTGEVPDLVNAPPQPATPAKQLGTLPETSATGAADQAASDYEAAYALLKANNYDGAEKAFGAFLKKYPGHVLSTNAKYWYGESYYARAQYDKAARIFAEAYQADMQGSKAADNLLKLGMSLAGMGNKTDACVAFRQLKKEGSKASGPVQSRADQEMTRVGC